MAHIRFLAFVIVIICLIAAGLVGCHKTTAETNPHAMFPDSIVSVRCTNCHAMQTICNMLRTDSEAYWEATVELMVKRSGVRFTSAEKKEVIAFLIELQPGDPAYCQ